MTLEQIGPYRIEGVLGRGGMGTVYRGVHESTLQTDAIKVLSPQYADDPHFRGRFESEIQALIKLNHPNIVQLLSYGQQDGMLFFAMELIAGNSLFQMQRGGHRFDWREIISITRDCAQGLRHAHDRGVIHRDLKPGNLLMAQGDDGESRMVKLTDFGIAKRYGSSQNTGTNILGTMDFMSPEQARGEPVTACSDLYSLGTVMYTLLSGKPPFVASSVEESIKNITRVPAPSIKRIIPGVPQNLDSLIQKLMAKRPEDRVHTALALVHQINAIEQELRDGAEARTAHPVTFVVKPEAESGAAAGTQVDDPESDINRTDFSSGVTREADSELDKLPATAIVTEHSSAQESPSGRDRVDFYKSVTEQVRRDQVHAEDPDEPDQSRGMWLTALGLAVVLLLGAYGIYRVNRPPSAETLYAAIDAAREQPGQVIDEMTQFLELYPDESRVEEVQQLLATGQAITQFQQLVNRLSLRVNAPNGLSEIEGQFYEIANLSATDEDSALAKMEALSRVYSGQELSANDQACVDAAAGYRLKWEHEQHVQVLADLKQVRLALDSAKNQDSLEDSLDVYRSILELFGDKEWGEGELQQSGRRAMTWAREQVRDIEVELARQEAQRRADEKEPEAIEGPPASGEDSSEEESSSDQGDSGNSDGSCPGV